MQDLSGAYNNLEVHSYQLEAQIRRLQNQAGIDAHPSGMHADMQCLFHEAV